VRAGSFWTRFAADLRAPLWALVVLAVLMNVVFPAWRVVASREGYILHFSDDAYYYFSVVPHIAAGQGPTADGVTRTTGWHPLYGFVLTGLYRLFEPSLDGLPRLAIALNAVLYLLSAYVLYLAGKCWWGKTAGLIAALLWLTCAHAVYIAAAGLETSTYALCLALLIWRLADLVTRPRTSAGWMGACALIGLCAGLTVLSRTDSILFMPVVALILLVAGLRGPGAPVAAALGTNRSLGTGKREPGPGPAESAPDIDKVPASALAGNTKISWSVRLSGVALFGLLTMAAYGAWILYVWHYTGEPNQGSAAVKMEWRKFLMRDRSQWAVLGFTLGVWGEFVLGSLLKVSALKWVLSGLPLLWATARSRAERGLIHLLWLVPVILGLAYGLLLDWTRAWYCVPALLTLTLLSAGAAAALRGVPPAPGGRGWRWLQGLAASTLGLIAWAVVAESAVTFALKTHKEFDDDSEKLKALRVAAWLEKNAEPGLRIGCWHSGIISYYTPSLCVINLDGLNNNDILAILRGDRILNPYWERIGLAAVIPPSDVDPKTGEVCKKMGRMQREWDGKRLVQWRHAPGVRKPAASLDVYEQALPQFVYRILEAAPATSAP
jgi:hypothetical protein